MISKLQSVRTFVSLFVCSLILYSATTSFAGSGGTVKMPSAFRKKMKNGIAVELDNRWTEGWGYRPVRIKFTLRKSKRDRTIRVDFAPQVEHNGFSYQDTLVYTTNVKIPQGEKSVTKTIYVPQQLPWHNMRADFYEGNRKLKDISMEMPIQALTSGNYTYNTGSPCVLLVDRDAPKLDDDRAALAKKLKNEKTKNLPDAEKFQFLSNAYYLQRKAINDEYFKDRGRGDDDDSLTTVAELGNIEMLPPSQLPDQFIGLTGIDLIIIPIDDLQQLAATDKARYQSLEYFVRNGGNLITFGDQEFDQLQGTVAELLDRDLSFAQPKTGLYPKEVTESYDEMANDAAVNDSGYEVARPSRKKAKEQAKKSKIPADTSNFVIGNHGLGRVVVINSADPYEERVAFWQWLMRSLGPDRLTWTDRHGISLVADNNDYWDFMIPGFGQSPVEGFLGVITLFILVIGPLNYYLLKKFNRMYYLPLTVVAAALLTTLTMMVYAVVSDGVATRVRLRSFTLLDQEGDENIAMSRCRQSYLAALSPSDGLIFPSQTCVYPILPYNSDYNNRLKRAETLLEQSGRRALKRDYIRSRTTQQFLTTSVETTKSGIATTPDGKHKNNFAVKLRYAFVCDKDKKLLFAKDVDPGAVIDLKPVVFKDSMTELTKYLLDNRPEAPEGLTSTTNNNMFFGRQRWNRYGQTRPAYTESALLHANMEEVPNFLRKKRPNTFMVISNDAPDFVHQGTKATEEAGFHVVRGGLK